MAQIEHQESSPYTQTRTQKSPHKQPFAVNFRSNYSAYTHHSNIQLQFIKYREETKKQMDSYLKQIDLLKQQVFRKNEQIEYLKTTVLMNLKKDLNDAQRDNLKNFKQSEKQARQIQKLRTDNFNMQQDLEKQAKQRRTYFAKLDDLKQIKQTTKRQILEKDKIIRTYAEQNRKLEKELSSCKLQLQDIAEQINEKDKRLFQSESEYKSILQKIFVTESELKSLQLRHRDNEMMISTYREKIGELQKQREQLMQKLDDHESRSPVNSGRQTVGQVQMLEVKSLMDQIYNLLDQKKQESKHVQKKFLASIACLDKALIRK